MQAPLGTIVPRDSTDGLFPVGVLDRAAMRYLRVHELRAALSNIDHMLNTLPAAARRLGAGDDLMRRRDRRQRKLDALLREDVER